VGRAGEGNAKLIEVLVQPKTLAEALLGEMRDADEVEAGGAQTVLRERREESSPIKGRPERDYVRSVGEDRAQLRPNVWPSWGGGEVLGAETVDGLVMNRGVDANEGLERGEFSAIDEVSSANCAHP